MVTTTPTQASAKTKTTETTPREHTTMANAAPHAQDKKVRLADTLRAPQGVATILVAVPGARSPGDTPRPVPGAPGRPGKFTFN